MRVTELTKDITGEDGRRTRMEVIAVVIRSYYDALPGAEELNATSQAMRSAQARTAATFTPAARRLAQATGVRLKRIVRNANRS